MADESDFSDASTVEAVDEDFAATFEIGIFCLQDVKDIGTAEEIEDTEEDDDDDLAEEDDDNTPEEELPTNGPADEVYFLQRRPEFLTVRQRALLDQQQQRCEGGSTSSLLSTVAMDSTLGLSEEEVLKRKRRALRRRELARDKSEKEKRRTVERLLKVTGGREKTGAAPTPLVAAESTAVVEGTECKVVGGKLRRKYAAHGAMIRFVSNAAGFSLSFPTTVECDLRSQKAPCCPDPILCGIPKCRQMKRYSCSKTGIPLCSLVCYKKNMANFAFKHVT